MFTLSGFSGLILLALDIWALVSTFSSAASTGRKVLRALPVIILPLADFVLWPLLGPKSAARTI